MVDIINQPGQILSGSGLAINPPFAKKAISRFFTQLLSSMNSYGEFTNDVVLDGDFVVRITHKTSNIGSSVLVGDSSTSDDFAWTDSNQLRIRINAGSFLSFGAAPAGITLSDNALHITEIRRVSGSITATTDGVAYATTLSNSDPFTINAVAQRGNGLYWNGEQANLYIEKAGAPVVNSPMDDAPSATYYNNLATVLGSNELSISGGATWTEVDGVYTETGNFSSFLNLGGFSGESFVLTYSDATGNVRTNNGTLEEALSGSGQVVITSGAAAPRIVGASGATIKPLSLVRIPSATPLIIKRNIAEPQVKLFDQVADGLTGLESWDDTTATTSGNATKTATGARFDLDAGEASSYARASSLTIGSIYRVEFDIENYTAGNIAENSSGFNTIPLTGDGHYSVVSGASTTTTAALARSGSVCHFDINNVSWKEFLEVAS